MRNDLLNKFGANHVYQSQNLFTFCNFIESFSFLPCRSARRMPIVTDRCYPATSSNDVTTTSHYYRDRFSSSVELSLLGALPNSTLTYINPGRPSLDCDRASRMCLRVDISMLQVTDPAHLPIHLHRFNSLPSPTATAPPAPTATPGAIWPPADG